MLKAALKGFLMRSWSIMSRATTAMKEPSDPAVQTAFECFDWSTWIKNKATLRERAPSDTRFILQERAAPSDESQISVPTILRRSHRLLYLLNQRRDPSLARHHP